MVSEPEPVDLDGMSLKQAFRALFGAHEEAPPQLYAPARSLARAEHATRSVEKRMSDLAEMSERNDRIFRDSLSLLSAVPSQPYASQTAWPATLARWAETLNHRATELLEREILPDLASKGFRILDIEQAAEQNGAWMQIHFRQHVYPLLTPLAVDPGRPFPFISSDSLNLLVELRDGARHEPAALIARVKIPSITPRLIELPNTSGPLAGSGNDCRPAHFIWSIDLVRHHIAELFVDVPIRHEYCFRVLRSSHILRSDQGESGDARGRDARGSVLRVDVDTAMPRPMFNWLVDHLDVISYSILRYESPAAAMSLPQLAAAVNRWSQSGGSATN